MPTDALPRIATYRSVIVWGTGTLIDTSPYDDVSAYYLSDPGLAIDGIGRDQARAYAPMKAPAFEQTLTNESQLFSPGGLLKNFLGRGAAVYVECSYGVDLLVDADDITVDADAYHVDGYAVQRLFDGTSIGMDHAISRGQRTLQVTALGHTATLLVAKKPIIALLENARTDEAISAILDWVGWPADKRVISTGASTLTYWWLDGATTAQAAINALQLAEGAGSACFEDREGYFHFESRLYRAAASRSSTVQYTFFDGVASENGIVDDEAIVLDSGTAFVDGPPVAPLFHIIPAQFTRNPDEVVKTVVANVNVRTPTTTIKVWEYGSALVLSPNEVRDVPVKAGDLFKSAVTPVAGVDYDVTVGSLVSVSLLTNSGTTITSRWTAGPSGATILGHITNGPQVRAISLPITTAAVVTSTVNTTSAASRTAAADPFTLDAWPELGREAMLDIVNSFAQRYQRERDQLVFRIANIDAAHMTAILSMQISDRVRFIHTHAALDVEAWVEQLHYTIAPGGGAIEVTVGCEAVFDLNAGKFDDTQFDVGVFGL